MLEQGCSVPSLPSASIELFMSGMLSARGVWTVMDSAGRERPSSENQVPRDVGVLGKAGVPGEGAG